MVSYTDNEFEYLNKKVALTNYSRDQFVREVSLGYEIVERPPTEYGEILRELRRIGSNVYQLLIKEMQTKFVDVVMLQDIYDRTIKMDEVFGEAFITN